MAAIKAFIVYNLTVVSRDISNNTTPYIQAECYTQTKQSYNYRLSLDHCIETDECEAPYFCSPKKYSDRVNDV